MGSFMSPGGRGTIVALDGELKVAIPLLGKKDGRVRRSSGAGRLPNPAAGR